MRLLLINPNTTASITALVAREAAKVASPGTSFVPVTGRFGGRYVASRATYAIAAHAALEAYAEHAQGVDGVALACFGDPGLFALREIADRPVVGMAEASMRAAARRGRRFGVVTGGALWGPMLAEFAALIGLSALLAGVRTVAPSGADIARDPEGSLALLAAACRACVEEDGAEAVILGGAGLAGLAERLAPTVPAPLVDGVQALVAAAEEAVMAHRAGSPSGEPARPSIEAIGLAPALASLVRGA
jgi:Asp/Glu/hydantoin racemase